MNLTATFRDTRRGVVVDLKGEYLDKTVSIEQFQTIISNADATARNLVDDSGWFPTHLINYSRNSSYWEFIFYYPSITCDFKINISNSEGNASVRHDMDVMGFKEDEWKCEGSYLIVPNATFRHVAATIKVPFDTQSHSCSIKVGIAPIIGLSNSHDKESFKLLQLMFPNTYSSGEVCWGMTSSPYASLVLPANKDPLPVAHMLEGVVPYFLSTTFNTDLSPKAFIVYEDELSSPLRNTPLSSLLMTKLSDNALIKGYVDYLNNSEN